MSVLFEYPKKAAYGRVLHKNKIYEHASPTTALKELFVREVDQIIWQYKLAPETINVPATEAIPEIQIFSLSLKGSELKEDVLRCIDRAIQFPILFELHHKGKLKVVASYKSKTTQDSEKSALSGYFSTSWMPEGAQRKTLPIALDLGMLYEALLSPLLPYSARKGETLPETVERIGQIRQKEQELAKCQTRLTREKQFNRKVEINAEIRTIKHQIKALSSDASGNEK